jgi:hypothetical protein
MEPASGSTKPAIRFSVVVLPDPLGPRKVMNSPGAIVRSMPPRATDDP